MTKNKDNPFHQACIDACIKLDKKKGLGTYAYNILEDNGIIEHILNGTLNLNDYTDRDLESFRGLGFTTIEILRVAWNLYMKKPLQKALDLDPAMLRGYSTGKDLIRWIKDHKLEHKRVYYAHHDCVGFVIETREFEGMEYDTTADLNVINGDYVEVREHIS